MWCLIAVVSQELKPWLKYWKTKYLSEEGGEGALQALVTKLKIVYIGFICVFYCSSVFLCFNNRGFFISFSWISDELRLTHLSSYLVNQQLPINLDKKIFLL